MEILPTYSNIQYPWVLLDSLNPPLDYCGGLNRSLLFWSLTLKLRAHCSFVQSENCLFFEVIMWLCFFSQFCGCKSSRGSPCLFLCWLNAGALMVSWRTFLWREGDTKKKEKKCIINNKKNMFSNKNGFMWLYDIKYNIFTT